MQGRIYNLNISLMLLILALVYQFVSYVAVEQKELPTPNVEPIDEPLGTYALLGKFKVCVEKVLSFLTSVCRVGGLLCQKCRWIVIPRRIVCRKIVRTRRFGKMKLQLQVLPLILLLFFLGPL